MNLTLLQNTLGCKELDPHTEAGQTTSKPLACRIMNLPSPLTVAMSCCSPGGTLGITHHLLSVKAFHWCHVDLAWSCAQVLEGTASIVVTQIPSAHPPSCARAAVLLLLPHPACTRWHFGQHSLPKGKQGIDRSSECFLFSYFESFQLHLDVSCLYCTRMHKTKVQVS